MRILYRLVVIIGKLLRLCGLFLMIRCFGIDGAGYLLAGLRATCDRCRAVSRAIVHSIH